MKNFKFINPITNGFSDVEIIRNRITYKDKPIDTVELSLHLSRITLSLEDANRLGQALLDSAKAIK